MDTELCECGNKGHRKLRAWLGSLSEDGSEDDDIPLVEDDELVLDEVEQEINQLVPIAITSQGYCHRCQGFIDDWPGLSQRLPTTGDSKWIIREHYETPFEVEAGDRSGCRLCALFVQGIKMQPPGLESFYKTANRLKCLRRSPGIRLHIEMHISLCLDLQMDGEVFRRSVMEALHIVRSDVPGDSWPTDYRSSSLTTLVQVGSTDRQRFAAATQLELAKEWLDTCSKSHGACRGHENYTMPTRLLAVSEEVLRLVETTDWDSTFRPQYATLSHCWGDIDFLTLTSKNLEPLTRSVPSDHLTKTFKDTIAIVRGLRIPYLWIDSLCILQDSPEDWEAEAGLMSSVYGNSTITIAATGAVNGNSGLFLRPGRYPGKIHMDLPKYDGTQGWDIAPGIYDTSVTHSTLAKRAWVLQERLLSPRILHFTNEELFWECRSLLACDSFPEKIPGELLRGFQFWDNSLPIYEMWQTVIWLYTQANLSFQSDKLVAVSGIARVAQKHSNDDYLAGMWRHEMEAQLCWKVQYRDRAPSSRGPYRAPSWSWASVDGEIIPHRMDWIRESGLLEGCVAHVLDAWTIPLNSESSDRFGRLSGGTLNVSSFAMLSGQICNYPRGGRSLVVLSTVPFRIRPWLDVEMKVDGQTLYVLPLIAQIRAAKSENDHPEGDQFVNGQMTGNDGSPNVGKSGGNVSLEVPSTGALVHGRSDSRFREPNPLLDNSIWKRITGLILRPTGAKKGEFSRVGQFAVQGQDKAEVTDFMRELNTDGAAVAESCCAETIANPKYSGERYLISIV